MRWHKASSHSNIEETFSEGEVTHLQEITQKIFNEALCQTYRKVMPVQQSVGLERLFQNEEFFQSFRYYLAKEVAESLGVNDRHVQAIYLFEPAADPEAEPGRYQPPETTLHLLVVANKPSAALDAFIKALERGLSRYLNGLLSTLPAGRRSILNVILVTEEAVEQREGYASLISSILAPSSKLWEREA